MEAAHWRGRGPAEAPGEVGGRGPRARRSPGGLFHFKIKISPTWLACVLLPTSKTDPDAPGGRCAPRPGGLKRGGQLRFDDPGGHDVLARRGDRHGRVEQPRYVHRPCGLPEQVRGQAPEPEPEPSVAKRIAKPSSGSISWLDSDSDEDAPLHQANDKTLLPGVQKSTTKPTPAKALPSLLFDSDSDGDDWLKG